ncbi:hypothetical protein C8Q79DRAFT_1013916 [Trametes meyenii]|nr:hypothetical protein C8Q79DRAFT_1013916 [Trametes meyenii]
MSSTSTSNAGNDDNSFLTRNSSIAFLAIGLFIGALLVLCTMRRYVSRRRAGTWRTVDPGPWDWGDLQRQAAFPPEIFVKDLGPSPEMYELYAVGVPAAGWENIMPVSAEVLVEVPKENAEERSSLLDANSQAGGGASRHTPLYPIGFRGIASRILPSTHRAQSSLSPPPQLFHASPDLSLRSRPSSAPTEESIRLRVGLAIAMPEQRSHPSSDVPLCALGMADVSIRGGSLVDLRS